MEGYAGTVYELVMDAKRLRNYAARVRLEDNGLSRRIIARVVGVTFEGRQEVLARVEKSTSVRLERDRRNEHDFYAVQVMVQLEGEWLQAGFAPRQMSKLLSKSLDGGATLSAAVHRLAGGDRCEFTDETYNYGLEIEISPKKV